MKKYLKKGLAAVLAVCLSVWPGAFVSGAADLALSSPSVLLMESSTGQILYEQNAGERRSPASITKIMTLLLIFDELDKGSLELTDLVTTSAHAKSMGGSQVFLEEGEQQDVETLIKCIVIASGNDASVAMAEHIAGSEAEFVARMNARAGELGMENTHFEDCCGLTESENHYTTAADVARMARELVTHYPQILTYSSIWMEDITHVTRQGSKPFTLSNTNKLIRSYDGCVGLKTGSTSLAKYCVCAVAERDGVQLIAVVMGAPDYKVRFSDAASMLNYGFGACSLYVDDNQEALPEVSVSGGTQERAACRYAGEFRYLDTEGQPLDQIKKEVILNEEAKAPVKKGEKAGKAVYTLGDRELGQVDILYRESVEKAGLGHCLKKAWEAFLLHA